MRKDLTGQALQFFQTQKRRYYSGSIHQQSYEKTNPFQDDHIITLNDNNNKQTLNIPNFFQNARKELLQTDQHSRIKSYSLDKPEKQIYVQRIAQTQSKARLSQIKSQQGQLNCLNDQRVQNDQHQGQSNKMLNILKGLQIDQTVKQQPIKKQDTLPRKEEENIENKEQKVLEIDNTDSIVQLNDSDNHIKTPEQKQNFDNYINIFENLMLKQKLQDIKQENNDNQSQDSSPFSKQKQIHLKCSIIKEEKKSPSIKPKMAKRKSPSQRQKQQQQDYQHIYLQKRDQCFEKVQTSIELNQILEKNKMKNEQLSQQHLQSKPVVQHKNINYIQYAFTSMQKLKMEENLEQAAFIPVEVNQKQQTNQQKILSVAKILFSEKEIQKTQKDISQDCLQKEDLNESIVSTISSRVLPPKNGDISLSKDNINQNDTHQSSRSLKRNSTEQSFLSQRNREYLSKKNLPKLHQQQKYKFIKIIQKSFGEDSPDFQSTSINSGRTPSTTHYKDSSPSERKKLPSMVEKENSNNMKISSSSLSLNENIKTANRLSTICLQKNLFNKLLKDQLQSFEEATSKLLQQPSTQKVYSFSQSKKILDHNKRLQDLTQTLQKQEKK